MNTKKVRTPKRWQINAVAVAGFLAVVLLMAFASALLRAPSAVTLIVSMIIGAVTMGVSLSWRSSKIDKYQL